MPKPSRTPAAVSPAAPLALLAVALILAAPGHGEVTPAQMAPPAMESAPDEIIDTRTTVVDVKTLGDLGGLVDKLADKRVVFVGESHDRYEDHLNQWAIIYGLHVKEKDLAIGMEFFQQPYQQHLDDYVAGRITEAELLRRTDYFERWRFDYRLYRPLLRLARDHGIPIVALNLEKEITEKVGDEGMASLSEAQRARIPADMDRSDDAYRARVRAVFDAHPRIGGLGQGLAKDPVQADEERFERFLSVQLLWDEGMADRAARYLQEHPGRMMVILAGAGHLEYGQGIPQRLQRRLQVSDAIVLNGAERDLDPSAADYLLYPRRVSLPSAGLLGVRLDTEAKGEGIAVKGFAEDSGAKAAGMAEGDRIVRVGQTDVAAYADIRIALLDSRPGQRVPVEVLRDRLFGGPERVSLEVELH